jgi:hypothetical protein
MATAKFSQTVSIVTLAQARRAGLRSYFSGLSCPYGHVCERSTSQAMCRECSRLRAKKAALPERVTRTEQLKRSTPELLLNMVISRIEAKAIGQITYFTGRPCKNGHVTEKYVSSHRCVECDRALQKVKNGYRIKLRERRAGREKSSQCDACGAAGKIVFDHCHQYGHFRGWICEPCNFSLGAARDDPKRLRTLADYLDRDAERMRDSQCLNPRPVLP